ncbi:hypothetical protein MMC14_004059 [Varicellaria rhodocarpa]|nr:hypothetical protein [Varicellaria rhodocarpa]
MSLRNLRTREEFELKQAIVKLGQDVAHLAAPTSRKSDMYEWREAFSLYIDYGMFFSTIGNENESRNGISSLAYKRLQAFFSKLEDNFPRRFKRHESRTAIQEFGSVNLSLLRNLKFQELSETAMSKILEKFDKRTSLQTRKTFSELIISTSSTSTTMAKMLCFEISEKVLGIVPQPNDYLCPVCFNISYKPADGGNLDPRLMTFLNRYFPKDFKVKQRDNERPAAVDQYGGHTDCQVM